MNMAGYRGQLKTCAGRRERFRRVYGALGVGQKLANFKSREKRDEFVMRATRQIPTSNSQLPTRRSYNQGEIRTIPDLGRTVPPLPRLPFGSWNLEVGSYFARASKASVSSATLIPSVARASRSSSDSGPVK
jgi:hypothetical protein